MTKSRNAHYFEGANPRAKKAVEHTKEMDAKYGAEIDACIDGTKLYNPESFDNAKALSVSVQNMQCTFMDTDSVSAILKKAGEGKTAILNFASYKNPGGMFIEGGKAQEECLCHESFLYNVLVQNNTYYAWYLNRALYSPDVIFERDNKAVKCDVITCAAPNYAAAAKYCDVTPKQNSVVLDSRIKFVLDIARDNHVDTLILGAYGAGVFGQSAREVGKIFSKYLKEDEYHCFKEVVFAVIPGGDNMSQLKLGVYEGAKVDMSKTCGKGSMHQAVLRQQGKITSEEFNDWYAAHCRKCIYEGEICMYGIDD